MDTVLMQMVASARLSALGTMAGGIAHEINNPLAVIHAMAMDLADMAADGDATPKDIRSVSGGIVEFADRISRVIRSLRRISRDGTNDVFAEVPLHQVLEHVEAACTSRFRESSVALEMPEVSRDIQLCCREVEICQVLINLLQNALDAAEERPDGKWVRVKVSHDVDNTTLSVIDGGHGIPADIKARIMDPFFTTKPPGKGTGLGLSLSRKIVEQHGGMIEITEANGHTCFAVRLPTRQEVAIA